ncbi:hypothetical protein D3C76_1217740 [compost metagenome]
MEVLHFLPVDDVGVEVQAESVDQALDVANRLVSVPARVHVEEQRPQAHDILGYIGSVRAIQTATQTDNAIEVLAFTVLLDFFCQRHQFGFATRASVPIGLDLTVEVGAVLANAMLIKANVRVAGVHDATRTNFVILHINFQQLGQQALCHATIIQKTRSNFIRPPRVSIQYSRICLNLCKGAEQIAFISNGPSISLHKRNMTGHVSNDNRPASAEAHLHCR